jgi:hypothetical protein
MHLKEELDDPKIMDKIRRVLTPQEFTRVDGIIDLVFSTTEDVKKEDELTEAVDEEEVGQRKPKFIQINFRDACAYRIGRHIFLQPLIKRSKALYSSTDNSIAVICINSREYQKPKHLGYWFAFHPYQVVSLQNYEQTYVALGCGSSETILLIPGKLFVTWLDRLNKTEREGKFYWHVRVTKKDNEGYMLRAKKGANDINLNEYLLKKPTK